MKKSPFHDLSKRERQVMDIVLGVEVATVQDVFDAMSDAPSYNSVRATMTVLVEKGHLRARRDGRRFVYSGTRSKERTRSSALQHLMASFFEGSATNLLSTLLDLKSKNLSEEEYAELESLIRRARKERSKD